MSTGQLNGITKEQSLIIKTQNGTCVITGCAHPGIVKIIKKSNELINDKILFVMGGFHLLETSKKELNDIISKFKQLNIKCVGPCHCSGDLTRRLFENEYK